MTHTKNPRTLYLEAHIQSENASRPIRMDAPRKASILKNSIWNRNFSRPLFLEVEYLRELADWLSTRYRRAALPGEFERRFKKVREAFWKLMQNYNHDVLAILFIFDEGQEKKECAKSEPYTLSISLVFQKGKTDQDFDSLIEKIYELFESNYNDQSSENAPEIEIRRCLAISESDITLEAYKAGVYMRSEWISYGTDPRGPVISV
jgi:DNA-binding ferritin-like protein (Dps family)